MAAKKITPAAPKTSKKGVLIWTWVKTQAEHDTIRLGAAAAGYPSMSAFLRAVGLAAAETAVEKIKKS